MRKTTEFTQFGSRVYELLIGVVTQSARLIGFDAIVAEVVALRTRRDVQTHRTADERARNALARIGDVGAVEYERRHTRIADEEC